MIDLARATAHLKKDKKLYAHMRRLPQPTFTRRGSTGKIADPFQALSQSIVYQQLSGKAAATIFKRFLSLFPKNKVTAALVLKLTDAQLRAVGLSGQKTSYIQDLARKFADGTIDSKNLQHWSDDEVRTHLVAVKGIGRWTADMFLIFYLHRPDVLPTGDLGIQKGFQKLHNLKKLPAPGQMETLAKEWAPWRTVASRYLWMIQDTPVKVPKKKPKKK